jgi:hypothetical protein
MTRLFAPGSTVDWPNSDMGLLASTWLDPILAGSPDSFITNCHTPMGIAVEGHAVLPFTVGPAAVGDSYVCSPLSHYVSYGREELEKLKNRPLQIMLGGILSGLERWLRSSELDRVVYANNWLLSTNLYPELTCGQIERIAHALVNTYPEHAIVFRSVDENRGISVAKRLCAAGARRVFSRRVLYQDPGDPKIWRKKQLRNDQKLLARTGYKVVPHDHLTESDMPRLQMLYNQLYLKKYSQLNPQFTVALLTHLWRTRSWRFTALRMDGRIDGVIGTYRRSGVLTTPLCGYDISLPQSLGLYRLLSMVTTLEAQAESLLVNDSAGVGHFKRLRGATPHREYNLVFDSHLPAHRRRAWTALKVVTDRIAIPIIERWDL